MFYRQNEFTRKGVLSATIVMVVDSELGWVKMKKTKHENAKDNDEMSL